MRVRRPAALSLAILLCGCGTPSSPDWPRWRGPQGEAVSDAAPLPSTWSATQGVVWKTAIPGEGASSPIVSGDAVFLTSALDSGSRRLLHCLDRRSGAIRWSLETKDANPERASALTGHAAATPVTDGSRVVAVFGNAGIVCADFSGACLWRKPLGEFDSELGLASSPILHGNLVIVVCDHDGDRPRSFESYLAALDVAGGATLWKTARPGLFRSWSTPIVVSGELIVSGQDEVRGYDPATGRQLWSVAGMSGWVTPSPVAGDGLIFAVSGKDGPTLAFRPGGRVAWREERGGPYVCSPVFYGGLLYVCDETGRLVCREGPSGKELYRERLPGKFTASPVAGDGKVYFTNDEGTTIVVKAGRNFERLSENRLGEECLASPAIADGRLFLRTRRHLWCLSSRN
ncbi:MAG: PQQ-binding-like beta-propeller repeat protein [Planctomycetes bacterium]|nr:PQQ-binding-like beta-propeller repeat protein [Planctomycetota bacterium]